MKSIAFFAFFAFALILSQPAAAYQMPPGATEQDRKIVDQTSESLNEYREKFGIKKLVYAEVKNRGQIVTLQYMPEDLEDLQGWTRMMEVSVYGLSGDKVSDLGAEKRIVALLETQYKRIGAVSANENYMMNDRQDIGMFIQYTVNPGTPQAVTAAGVFLRISDKAAAYMQINARGKPLKKKEAVAIHKLVNPLVDSVPTIQ